MRKFLLITFAFLIQLTDAYAYEFTMFMEGLERKGSDVVATFSLSYKGHANGSLYFRDPVSLGSGKTNEYDGKILVYGTDGTQFRTSSFYQGTTEISYGNKTEIPEDLTIKFTLTIYNVPKTDVELEAIEVKGLLVETEGNGVDDERRQAFALLWNKKEFPKSLQIHLFS